MDLAILAHEIKQGAWDDLMASYGASDAVKMGAAEIHGKLLESCGTRGGPVVSNCWFDIYWTASWVNALRAAKVAPTATVLDCIAAIWASARATRSAISLIAASSMCAKVQIGPD